MEKKFSEYIDLASSELIEKHIAETYYRIAQSVVNTNGLDTQDYFTVVFESIFSQIPEAQKGSFYELKEGVFKPIYCRGYDFNILNQLEFRPEEAFIDFESDMDQVIDSYEVLIKKRDDSMFSNNTLEVFKKLGTYENFAALYAPIKFEDKKIGLISFENFTELKFSNNSKMVLKIYAQLISNFYTLRIRQEKERDRLNDIIAALVSAIEIKDKYTEGHAKRVADISEKIAFFMRIPKPRIEMIKTAAILHDIGKIGVPTEILTKTVNLTDEEYSIIKNHSSDTKKILGNIKGFDEIVDFAYLHHEHYDGNGYPLGLRSDQIPIEAQIIQCADAYDAMTSNRAYRLAMPKDKVKNILCKNRGKQFHPKVVDAILTLYFNDAK